MIYSNIVSEDKVREVQKDTLNIIASSLEKSFGPKGSSTAIVKNLDKNEANISVEWTKDGHTIVNNILFVHPIERSVQDLLSSLTRYIVKEVGDGTTSAILLCKTVFETQVCPYFKKKGNGRFIDGYTKDKVKAIQLEFLNKLYSDISKQFAITFDKLTEILNLKDKIADSMKIVSRKIEKLSK